MLGNSFVGIAICSDQMLKASLKGKMHSFGDLVKACSVRFIDL